MPIEFLEPMKAQARSRLPEGVNWIYEIKFDGVRALVLKNTGQVSLLSRNEKDLTAKYRPIAQAFAAAEPASFIIDGEIVAVDQNGKPSFQLLQSYLTARPQPTLLFYAFDVLVLNGRNLMSLPLRDRKAMLENLIKPLGPPILYSSAIKAESQRVLREMKARGLEGLVAKDKNSPYEPGRRSTYWIKYKWTLEQEFIIAGYTAPQGTRPYFGSLILGYYEGDDLKLAGKVGTGFDYKLLKSLYSTFQKLKRPDSPLPALSRGKATTAWLSPSELRRITWIEPQLVCQVRFAEWTREGQLRQPAFVALREDKEPADVRREAFAA